ncbi:hypothetical protein [Rugamonas fusca]|uniref:hypothetical protein n=1 Tax=Rugamonas fusca TaxID=2758568 RepID=UPI001E49BF69|nr:hypothetical protein [Rugamonas fusca]
MTTPSAAGLLLSSRDTASLCVSDGLDRVMGDRALYLQLLHRFRDDYRALGQQLRQALADNALATLRPRVHTVRGAGPA